LTCRGLEPVGHNIVDSRRCSRQIVAIAVEGFELVTRIVTMLEGTLSFGWVLMWCNRTRKDSCFSYLPFATLAASVGGIGTLKNDLLLNHLFVQV